MIKINKNMMKKIQNLHKIMRVLIKNYHKINRIIIYQMTNKSYKMILIYKLRIIIYLQLNHYNQITQGKDLKKLYQKIKLKITFLF